MDWEFPLGKYLYCVCTHRQGLFCLCVLLTDRLQSEGWPVFVVVVVENIALDGRTKIEDKILTKCYQGTMEVILYIILHVLNRKAYEMGRSKLKLMMYFSGLEICSSVFRANCSFLVSDLSDLLTIVYFL